MNKLKKPTKEELIIKVAELELERESSRVSNELVRREFARAFKWFKPNSPYRFNDSEEAILPSWGQIWVHIGSLLNDRDLVDLTEKQIQLGRELKELRELLEVKE